ncbi:MAG: hypothetical protein JSU00_02160 [Acidobacteria bacterium]|nr:hypothetical protein [Acidobacteriota bacterium]
MRFIVKVGIPVQVGNRMVREGFNALGGIIESIKPEAVYFYEECGRRTGVLIVDLPAASGIPAIAEPFFLAFNASVEFHPGVAKAVETYG